MGTGARGSRARRSATGRIASAAMHQSVCLANLERSGTTRVAARPRPAATVAVSASSNESGRIGGELTGALLCGGADHGGLAAPAPEPVLAAIARGEIANRDRDRAGGIAGVALLDFLRGRQAGMAHAHPAQVRHAGQGGIEGKQNLVPDGDIAGGLAAVVHLGGFQVAEIADVVNRLILPDHGRGRLARNREARAPREDGVEDHAMAGVGLPPHSEIPRENLPQRVARAFIGLDGEADRRRGPGIFAALHLAPEVFPEHARHQRKFASSAGDVQRVHIRAPGELGSRRHRFPDQRAAALIEIGDLNGYLAASFLDHIQIHHDAPRVGMQSLLVATALVFEPEQRTGIERRQRLRADRKFGEQAVEIVSPERCDALGGDDRVHAFIQVDHRGVEGAAAQVVNQDPAGEALPVAEFDGSGRRLIQQAQHIEPGPAECFDGEESLVAVGVGGNAEHRFELLARAEASGQGLMQRCEQAMHQLREGHGSAARGRRRDLDQGLGPGILQITLERPDHSPFRVRLSVPGVPSEAALGAFQGHQGREPLEHRFGCFERHQRVVAAVNRRHHDASCTEVNTEFHAILQWSLMKKLLCLPALLAGCGFASLGLSQTSERLSNLRQLTHGGENAEAYWAPDGKRLIFQSTRDGHECDQIYTMNADGSDVKMVSTGKGVTTCGYFLSDNKHILFASTHEASASCPARPDRRKGYFWGVWPGYDIYLAEDNGKIIKKLTDTPGYDAEATINRKTKKIIYTSLAGGDLDIWEMNEDGSGKKQITKTEGYDGGPVLSPDGTKMAWRAYHPNTPEKVKEYRDLLKQNLTAPMKMELWVA